MFKQWMFLVGRELSRLTEATATRYSKSGKGICKASSHLLRDNPVNKTIRANQLRNHARRFNYNCRRV